MSTVQSIRSQAPRALFVALALGFSVIRSPAQAEPPVDPAACVFDTYVPTAFAPYNTHEPVGLGTYERMRGAQLFVAARAGLTREWLERSVQRALAEPYDPRAPCGPRERDLEVTVVSGGRGFWIRLGVEDERAAPELLRWARDYVGLQRARHGAAPPARAVASR